MENRNGLLQQSKAIKNREKDEPKEKTRVMTTKQTPNKERTQQQKGLKGGKKSCWESF
ncbi:hypothetical protein [Paenibacillus senegalimassiliensis]|uniref:hypothetical protein n=1 Tax=Paenibacillus senegalimassiliensis TaxID=1737426 RepID=UPI0012FDBD42|nr:hypothetical protein [Paenibacillus senegalimassiliensis]